MRELTGLSQDSISLVEPTIKALKLEISAKHPNTKDLLDSCMIAVDGEYQYDLNVKIGEGSEVAVIPPISGG